MKKIFLSLTTILCLFTGLTQELPAISKSNAAFFIPGKIIQEYGLRISQNDEWMKTYNNEVQKAKIQRLVDIRWDAGSGENALTWFSSNIKLLGEGGVDITSQISKPEDVDAWKVYTPSQKSKDLFESMGVEQNHYCFTFVVNRYIAKIFIATDKHQSLEDAWKLGYEGYLATITAAK